jgi:hypothetical protein
MPEAQRRLPTAEIEQKLLAALCSTGVGREIRAEIFERLAAHIFASSDHEIIFKALLKMPRAPREHLRETLSARITRLGFPDIDVEPLFELPPPPAEQISSLLQQLRG